jgi:hypothetical protein
MYIRLNDAKLIKYTHFFQSVFPPIDVTLLYAHKKEYLFLLKRSHIVIAGVVELVGETQY